MKNESNFSKEGEISKKNSKKQNNETANLNINEIKKEFSFNNIEEFSKDQKLQDPAQFIDQEDVSLAEKTENIISKWSKLQKIIKEEITLEDVIIKQQNDDSANLQQMFKKYYEIKLDARKTYEDIKQLNKENKDVLFAPKIYLENQVEEKLRDACEPIKNLLFIFRNNYDYLIKLISLISENDYIEKRDSVESLVELLNNQFFENILLPNPEQEELLILIYKLLEEQISKMCSASLDDFLNDESFLGIFLASYSRRSEVMGFISMIINPLILSIDNLNRDCLDLSIASIQKYCEKNENKDRRNSSIYNEFNEHKELNKIKTFLFSEIPKSRIKFKNNFELEAEKENEDDIKLAITSKDDDELSNLVNIEIIRRKEFRKTVIEKKLTPTCLLGKNDENNNDEYEYELNEDRLIEKINKEKDKNLKLFLIKQLDQINNDSNKYTNEGILKILDNIQTNSEIIKYYKNNFLFVRGLIDDLLQNIIDKISTIPYPLRCICKIILILISKKFPMLNKYDINAFIGKFILNKCIFPVLGLENKDIADYSRIFAIKTKKCLDLIINVLSKANSASLYNIYTDTEKTIFNQYLIEIIPIINKFYEKIVDVQLPKVLNDLIEKTKIKYNEISQKKMFNFRKKIKAQNICEVKMGDSSDTTLPLLFDYFNQNNEEILHLQSICFSIYDILFIISLIKRNVHIFSSLPKYNFFIKTYKRISNEDEILNNIVSADEEKQKTFFVICKEEKNENNTQLKTLLKQKKKERSTFASSEQDSDLICKRIKFSIKTILKGLNLLNNKDFAYLNMAKSSDKFFSALKFTLDELGEYSELMNKIPLKWYAQYIHNYKKELSKEYQNDDFQKLYDEIYEDELNMLNELKSLSSTVITRDGMNIRCAEKKIEKALYEKNYIEISKKYVLIEKFMESEEIPVCVRLFENTDKKENKIPIIISDINNCIHNNAATKNQFANSNLKLFHIKYIRDFILKFSENPWGKERNVKLQKLQKFVIDDIEGGERKNQIYKIIGKYMDFVKLKIKNPEKNKGLFNGITETQIKEFSEKIENHIVRNIYRYVYPHDPSKQDIEFFNHTKKLQWVTAEQLEIKKLYVNQLKFAEICIKKLNEAKSVYDKLDCIRNAYVIMNNTIKFSSGKNEDAGQDELTPLFQYILIKAQPDRLFSNINYIKCILSEADLRGERGFLVSQMESASSYILNITHEQLKISKEEFDKNMIN